MDGQVKEKVEPAKSRVKTLPVPYTRKAKRNLILQQGIYQQRHGKKINVKDLAGHLLETARLADPE